MRHVTIAAAILALGMVPAAAQSGSQSSGSQSGTQKNAAGQSQNQRVGAMSQDKLRKTLQQSGFQDITIVDAAYIVHAKTSDGDMVVMYINPPSAVSAASQGGTSSQGTTGSSSSSGSAGSSSSGSQSK
ncbi:hypothetical protein PQJ75_02195 [Rhodoplanes sp. TEM]|uniref:PepSY domain-containing protein n=1 Tax=Rhodoplanes tepidamans TaxID=200616 RepID=A0ABT5J701_RHOTP|nr:MULTISPECIES: hypothetical protein [Rhodoplanes]MDC7785059.1 hypothetical protein [Rhodoplanes tepidamans]MDC7982533.1 hypothetical protein [Rhodoplanes sp. TEM]MDQ0356547.1 hypothetical protein [Rhodoplanes tepidamans]